MTRVKGSEIENFCFRFNIVRSDLYQGDKIATKTEERKQKIPNDYVKSFRKVS